MYKSFWGLRHHNVRVLLSLFDDFKLVLDFVEFYEQLTNVALQNFVAFLNVTIKIYLSK